MKKLLTLTMCALFVAGCDDSRESSSSSPQVSDNTPQVVDKTPQAAQQPEEKKIKALLPEANLEKPFTKTDSGRVIFNNVVDLFEDESLYSLEDKDIIIHSKNPLKLTLKESIIETKDPQDIRDDLENKFIYNVFEIFAHTNLDKVDIVLEPVKQDGKSYGKKMAIKGNITRERALQVLQTYSAMKTFDDYVEFNPEKEYAVLGFSRSERAQKFNSEKFRKQIINGLLTGKIEPPFDIVQQRLDGVTDSELGAKMIDVGNSLGLSIDDNTRELNNGHRERKWSFNQISTLSIEQNKAGDIVNVTAQFGFLSEPEYVLQTMAVLAVAANATPNPDKTFKIASNMIEKIGKKLKKTQDSIKEREIVDGYTVEMTVHKSLGGLSFFTIQKLGKQPVVFE